MASSLQRKTLREGSIRDLEAVNAVIAGAISRWNLPERVKRLSLPLYQYHRHDLDFLELIVAEDNQGHIVGVAGFERADPKETPPDRTALLLHGIYVASHRQHGGIGTRLFRAVEQAARARGFDGVLVKAQSGAEGFFRALGLITLPVRDEQRDYPYRFWKPVSTEGQP